MPKKFWWKNLFENNATARTPQSTAPLMIIRNKTKSSVTIV